MMRKIAVGFLVLVLSLAFGTGVNMAEQAPEKTLKMAIYDLQEVLGGYQKTKDLQAEFEKQCQESLAKIKDKEEEIEKLKKELIAQEKILTKEAKEEKQKELESKEKEFQDLIKSIQEEIEEKSQSYTIEITDDILLMCQILKKEKGYDYILDKSSMPDLTKEILSRLNTKYKEGK
jgi:outer membrane protein